MLKFFRSKKFVIIAIIIVVILIGNKFLFNSKKVSPSFTIVKKGEIKEELTLSGKIFSYDHVTLNFAIAGKVDWVGVKEGDWVKKGQAVATLEKETLEATLRQKWQDFTAGKAASEKYYSGHTGNSESYDQKIERTALDATQNKAYDSVRIAQENLKSAVLYSPIEGLVISAEPSLAGVNITTLNSGYEIVNPSAIYFKATADQTEVGGIKEGQTGIMTFDSYPGEKVKGEVKNISFAPTKDETGTVYDIEVVFSDIDSKDYKYKLGMTADIDFVLKQKDNVLIIPNQYIKSDDKGKFVLIGKDKKKTYVKTGIEGINNIEITEGLREGDIAYD